MGRRIPLPSAGAVAYAKSPSLFDLCSKAFVTKQGRCLQESAHGAGQVEIDLPGAEAAMGPPGGWAYKKGSDPFFLADL